MILYPTPGDTSSASGSMFLNLRLSYLHPGPLFPAVPVSRLHLFTLFLLLCSFCLFFSRLYRCAALFQSILISFRYSSRHHSIFLLSSSVFPSFKLSLPTFLLPFSLGVHTSVVHFFFNSLCHRSYFLSLSFSLLFLRSFVTCDPSQVSYLPCP